MITGGVFGDDRTCRNVEGSFLVGAEIRQEIFTLAQYGMPKFTRLPRIVCSSNEGMSASVRANIGEINEKLQEVGHIVIIVILMNTAPLFLFAGSNHILKQVKIGRHPDIPALFDTMDYRQSVFGQPAREQEPMPAT